MKNHRIQRLQGELKKLFNTTLTLKMKDPALAWVNISEVKLSRDLRHLKLYFTHYNNPASSEEIREQLIKSSGFFKKQIAGAKLMRTIPELSFFYDDSEDRAEKVEELLARVRSDYDDDDDDDLDIDIEDYLDDDDYYDYDDDEDEDDYYDYEDDEDEEDE